MKKGRKALALAGCLLMSTAVLLGGVACGGNRNKVDKNGNTIITIEASGQNTSYKSTRSQVYDKDMNPYPYNTLEKLVDAWNTKNADTYGYSFTVSSTDINNDRQTLLPMYESKTAPEIHFYQTTTQAEDQDKGYFYDLSSRMQQPNKYSKSGEAGSVAWKDIYSAEEYNTFFATNGKQFIVPMEQNPIGLLYNKSLFQKAGITSVPTTYKAFMEAQDKLNAYAQTQNRADPKDVLGGNYICPYYTIDSNWYDLYLEGAINSGLMTSLDVIRKDGRIDAEEFARGYRLTKDGNKLFAPNSASYVELYRLICQMCKYYPSSNDYEAETQFLKGNVAMLEATGGYMRQLIDMVQNGKESDKFEIGVMPYPKLEYGTGDYYSHVQISGNVRGGLSGYSTGWVISNSAMSRDEKNGNSKCVDACVDMLMYLSAYENNDKMVNDKGFAIPLSGNTSYSYYTQLAQTFQADSRNTNSLAWGASSLGGAMTKDFYDAVFLRRKDIVSTYISDRDNGTSKLNIATQLQPLYTSFSQSVNYLYQINQWDAASWPAA